MRVRIKDKGGIGKLDGWAKALESLPKEMRKMPRLMAEEAVELTRQTFEDEADPYGKPWAPLKLRSGRILAKTGGLKSSIHVKPHGKGFTIGVGKSYAGYHQQGTGIHGPKRQRIKPLRAKALGPINPGGKFFRSVKGSPRRAMLPYDGLPPTWTEAFKEVAGETIGKKLKTAGKKRKASTGSGLNLRGGGSKALGRAISKGFESLE